MALIICPECGEEVSDHAAICPNCGISINMDAVTPGTPQIDDSTELEKLYVLARSAKNCMNDTAVIYYNRIKVLDPTSWEAHFYSVYCQAQQCTIAQIIDCANLVSEAIPETLALIQKTITWKVEQRDAYSKIGEDILALTKAFQSAARSHYNTFSSVDNAGWVYNARALAAYNMLIAFADNVWSVFSEREFALSIYDICKNTGLYNRATIAKKIRVIDPVAGEKLMTPEIKARNSSVIKSSIFVIVAMLSTLIIRPIFSLVGITDPWTSIAIVLELFCGFLLVPALLYCKDSRFILLDLVKDEGLMLRTRSALRTDRLIPAILVALSGIIFIVAHIPAYQAFQQGLQASPVATISGILFPVSAFIVCALLYHERFIPLIIMSYLFIFLHMEFQLFCGIGEIFSTLLMLIAVVYVLFKVKMIPSRMYDVI